MTKENNTTNRALLEIIHNSGFLSTCGGWIDLILTTVKILSIL